IASDGTVTDNLNGTFTITPTQNFNGTVTLNYDVIDGNGGSIAATQSYTLAAVNDDPTGTATASLPNGTEDTPYTVNASDLLASFSDVDDDTLSIAALIASDGTVTDNLNGTFTITPTQNFNGTVTLNYDVIDGNGGSIAATQSYTLAAVNDDPTGTATASLPNGTEDTPYTVNASDLLASFSDVD
ncbi:cadherin-like domain-containing protein, partial [Nitrosomonas sp. Is37]|uniref:cadherin-like domain-containing protein n=1 Tax=Nitrosomonas sp. Is37 TaxID=3080535 RepID=UPI00294AC57B